MISFSEIAPSKALTPFIESYTYREFDTVGENIVKPWHASHQLSIIFFFKELPVKLIDTVTGKILKTGKNCDVVGMSTQYNGEMTFNGSYAFFQIIFKPHGFHTLFQTSPIEITNKISWSEDIFNADIKFLHEQLYEASTIATMAEFADAWLLHYLSKQKWVDYRDKITVTANMITQQKGLINIDKLAAYACMSKRNFERVFIDQTGMSPKHLCCISRFNNALELKLKNPFMKWISIAQNAGYFDQMHLIKDFKNFCGEAPSSFLKHEILVEERG